MVAIKICPTQSVMPTPYVIITFWYVVNTDDYDEMRSASMGRKTRKEGRHCVDTPSFPCIVSYVCWLRFRIDMLVLRSLFRLTCHYVFSSFSRIRISRWLFSLFLYLKCSSSPELCEHNCYSAVSPCFLRLRIVLRLH